MFAVLCAQLVYCWLLLVAVRTVFMRHYNFLVEVFDYYAATLSVVDEFTMQVCVLLCVCARMLGVTI